MLRRRLPEALIRPYSNDMTNRRNLHHRSDYARQRGKQRPKRHFSRYILLILVISTFLFGFEAGESVHKLDEQLVRENEETVKIEVIELKNAGQFTIYAYNSVESQTDGSPCISADNKDICERFANGEKMVATNDFPLGTELFLGDLGRFIVVDRMRSDYRKTVDIFMGYDVAKAKEFGKQKMPVLVAK